MPKRRVKIDRRKRLDPNVRGKEERDELVMKYYRLPFHIARRMMKKYPQVREMGVEDAAQWGFLALVRAAEIWNPAKKVSFMTYAYSSIHRRIFRESIQTGLVHMPVCAFTRGVEPLKWQRPVDCGPGRPNGFMKDTEPQARPDDTEQVSEIMLNGLKTLPAHYRKVVELTCIYKESGKAVAKKMKPPVSPQRVYQMREEGLERLRKYLAKVGID